MNCFYFFSPEQSPHDLGSLKYVGFPHTSYYILLYIVYCNLFIEMWHESMQSMA